MAISRMSLIDLVNQCGVKGDLDFLQAGMKVLAQAVMELEVAAKTGAERHERTDKRTTYRNGYRNRMWDTRVGTIELQIPKLRDGSYFPTLLEPRRKGEQALRAVLQEAYVLGVSTRKVDELVKSLGISGVSKSEVSRVCRDLDEVVSEFRNRRLEADYPYVWLDATYLKIRENHRVLNMAMVVAVGIRDTGEREILGHDLGPAEDGAFWLSFLRGLVARGLRGVQLVISDAHSGLRQAIPAALATATWQRCRVHFVRNIQALIPKSAVPMVTGVIRTIFAQPDITSARMQIGKAIETLEQCYPRVAKLLEEAGEDTLAHMAFPAEHRRQIHSTNPLERLNKEIKRRTDVVGIFPNREAAIRLVGAILLEQHDEWAVGKRYFSQESMNKLGEMHTQSQVVSGPLLEAQTSRTLQ